MNMIRVYCEYNGILIQWYTDKGIRVYCEFNEQNKLF